MFKKFFMFLLFILSSCGGENVEGHFNRNDILREYNPELIWKENLNIDKETLDKNFLYPEMNSQLVKDFWQHMSFIYGTTITDKNTSYFMSMIGGFLSILGILDKEIFLNEYATTIKKTIYLPFRVGETLNKKELLNQILLCVHEHQHVVQYNTFGKQYSVGYLFNHRKRAFFETEAYSTSLEIYYWFFKKTLNTQGLANMLYNYGCNKTDVLNSKKILDVKVNLIKQDKFLSDSSKTAIVWLNKNAKNLQVRKKNEN